MGQFLNSLGIILAKSLAKSVIKASMGVQPPQNIKEFSNVVATEIAAKAAAKAVVGTLEKKFLKK